MSNPTITAGALLARIIGLCDDLGLTDPDVPTPDMVGALAAVRQLAAALGIQLDPNGPSGDPVGGRRAAHAGRARRDDQDAGARGAHPVVQAQPAAVRAGRTTDPRRVRPRPRRPRRRRALRARRRADRRTATTGRAGVGDQRTRCVAGPTKPSPGSWPATPDPGLVLLSGLRYTWPSRPGPFDPGMPTAEGMAGSSLNSIVPLEPSAQECVKSAVHAELHCSQDTTDPGGE